MPKKESITVQGTEITVISSKNEDYISLTDMANAKEGEARAADIIKNWIRTRTTLEFLGTWERLTYGQFNHDWCERSENERSILSFSSYSITSMILVGQ